MNRFQTFEDVLRAISFAFARDAYLMITVHERAQIQRIYDEYAAERRASGQIPVAIDWSVFKVNDAAVRL